MSAKHLPSLIACGLAGSAFGQITTLVPNTTMPSNLSEDPEFSRSTHYTFDLWIDTTDTPDGPSDWYASEVSVYAYNGVTIWHSYAEQYVDETENLTVPFVPDEGVRTREYDTFFTMPGAAWFTQPRFAAPGGIVSTPTKIRGHNASGDEIPLTWFNTEVHPEGNRFIGMRLTLLSPDERRLTLEPRGEVAATLQGFTAWEAHPPGAAFEFTVYRVPEPGMVVLVGVGTALLITGRRAPPVPTCCSTARPARR